MLIAYIISVIVCFIFCVLASKYHDGGVTIGDVIFHFLVSFIPIFNVICMTAAIVALLTVLNVGGFFNKKLW